MPSKTQNSSDKKNKKQIKKERQAKHEIKSKIQAFFIDNIDKDQDAPWFNKEFRKFLKEKNIYNNENTSDNYSIFQNDDALKEYKKSLQPSNLTISLYVCWYVIEFLVALVISVMWLFLALFIDGLMLSIATSSCIGLLLLFEHPECFCLGMTSYIQNIGDLFHNASYYTYGKKQYTDEKIDEIYNKLVDQYKNDKTQELVGEDNETTKLVEQDNKTNELVKQESKTDDLKNNESAFLTNYIEKNKKLEKQTRLFPLSGLTITLMVIEAMIACLALMMPGFSRGKG